MNKVILIGRLTREPEIRYSVNDKSIVVGRYTLAVPRMKKDEADFINCVAFKRAAEFAEKYLHQGMKIAVTGRIQTGSYTNKEGQKIYTTDVIIEEQEFVEKKSESQSPLPTPSKDGFMNIPDGLDCEDLPFN